MPLEQNTFSKLVEKSKNKGGNSSSAFSETEQYEFYEQLNSEVKPWKREYRMKAGLSEIKSQYIVVRSAA